MDVEGVISTLRKYKELEVENRKLREMIESQEAQLMEGERATKRLRRQLQKIVREMADTSYTPAERNGARKKKRRKSSPMCSQ